MKVSENITQTSLFYITDFIKPITQDELDTICRKIDTIDFSQLFTFNSETSESSTIAFLSFFDDFPIDSNIIYDKILNEYVKSPEMIISIPKVDLSANDYGKNFTVCHLPMEIRDQNILMNLFQNVANIKISFYNDLYLVNCSNSSISLLMQRLFSNFIINGIKPIVAKNNMIKSIPMISISNIPDKFNMYELKDMCNTVANVFSIAPFDEENGLYKANVTFDKVDDALKVIQKLNYSQVYGNEIIMKLIISKSCATHIKEFELKIQNLPKGLLSLQIFRLFNEYGEIYKAIIKDEFAKVQFYNKEDAEKAKAAIDGAIINGNEIKVFLRKTIVVYNLYNPDEASIKTLFNKFKPYNIKIMHPKERRPIVFVSFDTENDAQGAIEVINKINVSEGLRIYAHPLLNKEEIADKHLKIYQSRNSKNSLFIQGLPEGFTQEDLIKLFKEFGVISSVIIFTKNVFVNGIVQFVDEKDASDCLTKFSVGKIINGNKIIVKQYNPNESKEKHRKKTNQNNFKD